LSLSSYASTFVVLRPTIPTPIPHVVLVDTYVVVLVDFCSSCPASPSSSPLPHFLVLVLVLLVDVAFVRVRVRVLRVAFARVLVRVLRRRYKKSYLFAPKRR